jgi:TM2 domain-containing membrane protein YozV
MAKKTVKKVKRTIKPKLKSAPIAKSKPVQNEQVSETLAIICLLLNIIILPGLGTLIAKRTTPGIIQLVLFIIGIPLSLIIIGIPLMIAMWVWALISGIDILKKAKK